ncbi:murein hydrolase activator EnvC family protein [Thalassotalea piscium]|uniref:Septal ring factor EnvC (AmiA/AmiB activator) n=1 Tax=Thalassotalea piscium TaxID=1230533 RepID=A0A7X0NJ43_9GAMM|nr:peptidoglycan DD-metalloendopeptidase family protein [Thalassotalea piscium]MBB6544404.1 septal ring factor EnvC (AmiA/AmiB activator) [Thalassotalea piscium]
MSKHYSLIIALWLGCISYLASSIVIVNANPFRSAQENETDQKLDQIKKEISQQKTTIKQVNSQRNKLEQQLKQSDLAISTVVKKLAITQQQLAKTQSTLASLEQQQIKLLAQKQQQEELLAKQLRAAYSSGNHDYIKLLLNQENPAKVQRSVTYYQYLNNARIAEIDQFKNTITQLHQVKVEQMEEAQKLQQLKQEQTDQQQQFSQQKKAREQTIAKLNKQLLNSQQKLNKLEQEEANLKAALARIAKLSQQEASLNGLSQLKRKLSWPVKGKIRRSFGSSKQGYLKWKGVLLSAPVGKQVTTIHNGTVLFSDWLKGYGLVTVVDHGDGYMSLYGHNQALLKSVGDRVETGEPIALVGQSGGQNQSGLYFEIRHNGQAVNPKLWCR